MINDLSMKTPNWFFLNGDNSEEVSSKARHCITLMLNPDPNSRIELDTLMKHEWFVGGADDEEEDVLNMSIESLTFK